MTRAAILEGIAEVARRHLGWHGALTPAMRLVEDLRLETVGDLVDLLAVKLQAG